MFTDTPKRHQRANPWLVTLHFWQLNTLVVKGGPYGP